MTAIVTLIGNVAILLSIVPLGYFIYRYARFSPWTSDILGIGLMTQKIVLAAVMGFILITIGLDALHIDWDWRAEFRLVFFVLILASFIFDDVQLVRIQRQRRRK
jgi:hypothetical protein